MVKNGQRDDIRSLRYAADGGVEVITFPRLRGMPAGGEQPPLQRADFHVLAIVDSGRGAVTVDFVHHRLKPGMIVWIRPGRVHRWDDIENLDGTLVLFRPEAVPHGSPGAEPFGPVTWRRPELPALVRLAADHLRREYDASRARPIPGATAILRALLEVLLLRAADCAPPPPAGREAFTAYATAVEAHFATSREVAWYARRLGYSPRTLSRATREATGRSAKRFLDDRVVLEAKRLLAHTGITVAECARRTGFDDTANFSKFFRARAGLAPGAFATQARIPATNAPPAPEQSGADFP
ncbi:helix-turn-helix domain-containing protein [Actinomadura nitritigenes]|uniref:helix-turn-helix domain-containing protein n=1 Tax=Actinomadura nitritigenes TaxID=134602 RepID=UPI003D8E0885